MVLADLSFVSCFPSLKCPDWSWLSLPVDVFHDTITMKQLSPVSHEMGCFCLDLWSKLGNKWKYSSLSEEEHPSVCTNSWSLFSVPHKRWKGCMILLSFHLTNPMGLFHIRERVHIPFELGRALKNKKVNGHILCLTHLKWTNEIFFQLSQLATARDLLLVQG